MTWRDISGPGSDPIASGADIHGDNMALVFDPIEPSVMYLADDGGVTKGITNDVGAVTWRPLSQGLVIGQFGTIGIAPLNSNVIAGGLWHNNDALTQNGGGLWQKFGRGDGYQVKIDAGNPNIIYYNTNAAFGWDISRFNALTGADQRIYTALGKTAHWADPFRRGNLLIVDIGSLFRMQNADATATVQSINPPGKQGNITAVAFERRLGIDDKPVYYVGTDRGEIWRGEPDGAGWARVCGTTDCNRPVTGLASDPNNVNRLFATFAGDSPGRVRLCERNGNWNCDVIDGGFTPDTTAPKDFIAIVVDPNVTATVYVATDQGVYRGQQDGQSRVWNWSFSPGIPHNAIVSDLQLHQNFLGPVSGVIRAGTYGRGVWELVRLVGPVDCPTRCGIAFARCLFSALGRPLEPAPEFPAPTPPDPVQQCLDNYTICLDSCP
jgi:hypothetical protein